MASQPQTPNMNDLLQRLTAFPSPEATSPAAYDKEARGLVSLLHSGKLLGGGGELINVSL